MNDKAQREPYKVHLADVSYFSGKLEAYLRYKEIPFERMEMDAASGVNQVYANTGVRKVPAVESADGLWFKETTNIIDWFEKEYPNPSISPDDPALQFLCKLVEDYADEWCWRSAMYWRWRTKDNATLLGSRIGHEVFADWPMPASWAGKIFKLRQRMTFLQGDGLTAESEPSIRDQYHHLSQSITEILNHQPFLLGEKPSLVDFAFMGPFFRHYFCDPVPAMVMRDRYPVVLAWVARMWGARASHQPADAAFSNFSPGGWEFILRELVKDYMPYLQANKAAWEQGKKRFNFKGTQTTLANIPVVRHRVYCLEILEELYQALPENVRSDVDNILRPYGELPLTGKTVSGIRESYDLPLRPRKPVGKLEYLEAYLLGSPWDINRPE